MTDLQVIEVQGVRVLTTAQLAEKYGTDTRTIKQNFNNNKAHYEEGKHFIRLENEALREFKNKVENFDLVGKRANTLYLWTERGALLHAKSLNTDTAWAVYDELVETYFRARTAQAALQNLSPQLQMMIKLETEHNALAARVSEIERKYQEFEQAIEPDPEPEQLPLRPEPKKWSEREADYLRRAYALGQSDTEIAADLGRTVGSIRHKKWSLGLGDDTNIRRHWTPEQDRMLIRLVKRCLSTHEIAQIMKRSPDGISNRRNILRKAGKI